MWVPVSRAPHWSSNNKKGQSGYGSDQLNGGGSDFGGMQLPAHLMHKPKIEVLDAEVRKGTGNSCSCSCSCSVLKE